MKLRYILGSLVALLTILALAAVACGGDDDDGGDSASVIRTQKGLTVANIDQFSGVSGESNDGADSTIANPGEPAPAVGGGASVANDQAIGDIGGTKLGFGGSSLQQSAGSAGLTVQGYGTATIDADSAKVEFYFGSYNDGKPVPIDEPLPPDAGGGSSSSGSDDGIEVGQAGPITEEDLQPVIDALEAAGADDVEFVEQPYYDPYYASATLRATVSDLDALDGIVSAGTDAASGLDGISLQSSNVIYTVSDCSALQQAALKTAIEDAGDNADVFAAALGVTAGDMIGASNLSWYPNDGTGCDSYWGYYPVYADAAFVGGPAEVYAYAQVAITYAMQ